MAKKRFAGKWLFWGVFVLLAIVAVVITIRPDPGWVDFLLTMEIGSAGEEAADLFYVRVAT